MEMEDQFGISDLRQLMNGRPHFPTIPQPPELFSGNHHHHRNLTSGQPYEMIMMGRHEIINSGLHEFRSDSAATSNTSLNVTPNSNFNGGLDSETNTCFGADAGTGRWPRQETLTLLEIRSRLDSKFKEANQKGPLWDEVSRIMCEEHGYQRSGKKCREKFENLYKYYKKTKEGKAGRQDGKHYRFFRQLEALYGETSNQVSIPESNFIGTNHRHHSSSIHEGYQSHKHNCDSLSMSQYSSEFDSSSSEDNNLSTASGLILENDNSADKRRKRRGSWRLKIKELIDSQMKKLMDKQEAWLEKLMKTLEQKERERNLREEEWRRLEGSRLDREHKFWARERASIEARDSVLFEALQKLTGKEMMKLTSSSAGLNQINEDGSEILNNNINGSKGGQNWSEIEINRLIQLRASVELKFEQDEFSDDEVMWEDIATKMVSFGFDRSALMFKEKWESLNSYILVKKANDEFYGKKRKENSRGYNSNFDFDFQNHESRTSIYNDHHGTYSYDINEVQGPHGGGGGGGESSTGIGRLQSSDGASPSDTHNNNNNNSSSNNNNNNNNNNARNNNNNNNNNNNASNAVHDACFPFLMGNEADHNLWDNYGSLKLNKGGHNQ